MRCLAKLAFDTLAVRDSSFEVETDSGNKHVELLFEADEVVGARVGMGVLRVAAESETVEIAGRAWTYRAVDAGNPHVVIFGDEDPSLLPVLEVGAAMQDLARFPDGVNVEFVRVRSDGIIEQRTFERGSGETHACGSGATAVACASFAMGHSASWPITVELLGGTLVIDHDDSGAVMAGPARTVFSGQISVPID